MTTYKGSKGLSVESLAADPIVLDAWAVEANIGTARYQHRMAGTTSAALLFQGNSLSPYDNLNTTETWNGTSWAAGNNTPFYTRGQAGFGTQSSAVSAGGYAGTGGGSGNVNTAITFDGTSWAATGACVTVRSDGSGNGADASSGIIAGGWCPGICSNSEIFNGSSWAATEALVSPGQACDNGCAGIKTSAMLWGGDNPTRGAANTQIWNDTCWAISPASFAGSPPSSPGIQNASGAGASNTSAINMGGARQPGGADNFTTQLWDGTSWTLASASINPATASFAIGSTGTKTAAMITGGRSPGAVQNQCQTYTAAPAPASARVAVEGQMWYNTASNVLKTFDGTDIQTVTSS